MNVRYRNIEIAARALADSALALLDDGPEAMAALLVAAAAVARSTCQQREGSQFSDQEQFVRSANEAWGCVREVGR